MRLIDKLKAIKTTTFEFASFTVRTTTDDQDGMMQYVVFELSEPIATVVGTQRVFNPMDRTKEGVLIQHSDVTEVECAFDVIDEFETDFTFDEDADGKLIGSGKYSGNLRLDVSKQGRVWLVKESLAKRANTWKSRQGAKRYEAILEASRVARS